MIENRLRKNLKKKGKIAKSQNIEAFRLYECDIPEFPFIVDIYKDYIVIYDRRDERDLKGEKEKNAIEFFEAINSLFPPSQFEIIQKVREKQKGQQQYEKLDKKRESIIVKEDKLKFEVNCYDYLDTGLFLDHRPLRKNFSNNLQDLKFLNLFCYTGAVSVAAAYGGAFTTSVDMSKTYIDWAKRNFSHNQLDLNKHEFITQDVLQFLQAHNDKYDLIFIDPPTFSNSKRMDQTFEVEKDQDFLIDSCVRLLNKNGKVYFSNNKKKFRLSTHIGQAYQVKDITGSTIPFDFHNKKIHNCFIIQR